MTDVIDIPPAAQAALDGGAMYTVAASIQLPNAQSADGNGAAWLFTAHDADVPYNGATYLAADSPLLRFDFPSARQSAEGEAAMVLADPGGVWESRINAAGMKGNAVTMLTLLPYGNNQGWPMDTFNAFTDSIEPKHDRREGRVLRVVCEDALFRAKEVPGEFATDGYQRKLSAQANQSPYDNSHKITSVSRTRRWHTR